MTDITKQFIRKDLQGLMPYPASLTLDQLSSQLKIPKKKIVKLNTAENSGVQKFYPKRIISNYYSYPDPFCLKLRQKIGKYTSFGQDWIACGNGSDELIDLLIALFVGKDEEILLCPPTFPMYEFCANVRGVKIKKVNRNRKLKIDFDKVISAIGEKTKLIFIDSPGNPSGTVVNNNQLRLLLKRKVIIVVDEAYFEYSGKTAASLVKKYPNLIVIRSFSKWAGLGGLRLGYLIANPKIVENFLLIKQPYNVNVIAQELGIVALKKRKLFLKKLKNQLVVKRQIVGRLQQFKNLEVGAGEGCYILVRVKNNLREKIVDSLKNDGVLVKPINQPGLQDAFLVSLEFGRNMNKLIKSLSKGKENL